VTAHKEDSVILGVAVLIQCQGVTDRQTDRRTDTIHPLQMDRRLDDG